MGPRSSAPCTTVAFRFFHHTQQHAHWNRATTPVQRLNTAQHTTHKQVQKRAGRGVVCWWFILAKHFVLLTCRGLETLAVSVLKCAKWFAGTATTAGTHTPSTKRTPAFWCLHLCTTSNRRTAQISESKQKRVKNDRTPEQKHKTAEQNKKDGQRRSAAGVCVGVALAAECCEVIRKPAARR